MPAGELLAELLIDSYDPGSPLVRLATLASPACRIEPQLLRGLRRACVAEADVSIEQELWFSELVASRGRVITFTATVTQELRRRLRALRLADTDLVEAARQVMLAAHAELPRALRLEDELAWAEIVGDDATMHRNAEAIVSSLQAGRDGLDNWLARAWPVLPRELKRSPHGELLAEVAAARGAAVEQPPAGSDVTSVLNLLPRTTVLLSRSGRELWIEPPPDDATMAIDIPDTRAPTLTIRTADSAYSVDVNRNSPTAVAVGTGLVTLITESGAEYELEPVSAGASTGQTIAVEMLAAAEGTSVLISFGDPTTPGHILVDTGPRSVRNQLVALLRRQGVDRLDLLVLTHIDDDAIGGAVGLLEANEEIAIADVWFNGYAQLADDEELM
jgi:Metallo-beta-lactamase superfamily